MNYSVSESLEIVFEKLNNWWRSLIAILPNLLLAILVIIGFIFLARYIRKFTLRIMPKMSGSEKHSIDALFANMSYVLILSIGIFISLNILNLNKTVSSLLAGAGIIGLVLGFAFQDLSSNFISGIYIAFKRPFDLGETIETNGYTGNIEEIQLRSTTIRTSQGLHLIIPNKDVFQKPILNYSRTTERRVELSFSISPEHDPRQILSLCKLAVEQLSYIAKDQPVEVYYTAFADNMVKVAVWFWIYNNKPPGFMVAQNDAIVNIIQELGKQNIPLITPVTFTEQKKQAFEGIVKEKIQENHQRE